MRGRTWMRSLVGIAALAVVAVGATGANAASHQGRATPSRPKGAASSAASVRQSSVVRTERVSLPYRIEVVADSHLASGVTRVARPGAPGVALLTVREWRVAGVLRERQVLAEKVLVAPKPELVLRGTSEPSRSLETLPAVASLTVVASAYWADPAWSRGITATGVPVHIGSVAVDPTVIPLGTRLYIPGYGYGIADDTGSAIRGDRIDVYFPSEAEALAWGLRTVRIEILGR